MRVLPHPRRPSSRASSNRSASTRIHRPRMPPILRIRGVHRVDHHPIDPHPSASIDRVCRHPPHPPLPSSESSSIQSASVRICGVRRADHPPIDPQPSASIDEQCRPSSASACPTTRDPHPPSRILPSEPRWSQTITTPDARLFRSLQPPPAAGRADPVDADRADPRSIARGGKSATDAHQVARRPVARRSGEQCILPKKILTSPHCAGHPSTVPAGFTGSAAR